VFSSKAVQNAIKEFNILVVKADHTNGDPIVKKDLERANRKSLPTNLIYPADPTKPAIMLPEYLTPEIVVKAIKQAASK